MFSTYLPEDVTLLLKDITGLVAPMEAAEREALIQSGAHYSETLPKEYEPSPAYFRTYERALELYAGMTAEAVATVAEAIWREKGERAALVSLARAGTPVGILIKRYMQRRYGARIAHYSVSIIRGRGIDRNAMGYILARHRPEDVQFVDGWTGKGAIQRQLDEAMRDYPGVAPGLAVLSDPARLASRRGTFDDFLIPSACLNATVSGLLSRTFLRTDIIGPNDFHGVAFYRELLPKDVTNRFLSTVEAHFDFGREFEPAAGEADGRGLTEARDICAHFGIADINLCKPGIGEATRVLLRRAPWKLLVWSRNDETHLAHLYQLAREKGVPVEEYPLQNYRACGLIRRLADN